jgi:hypothetical protein
VAAVSPAAGPAADTVAGTVPAAAPAARTRITQLPRSRPPPGERRAAGELMQGGIIEQRRELGRVPHGPGLQIEPPVGQPRSRSITHRP